MDGTHNTNTKRWNLFTIFVRTEEGSWIPGAFFYSSSLSAVTLQACLGMIRDWCGGTGGWRLKYMLTDDSAAEQKAVQGAFDSHPDHPDPPVVNLLCTRHSWETLKKNIKDPEVLSHMAAALFARRTEQTCHEFIDADIAAAEGVEKLHTQLGTLVQRQHTSSLPERDNERCGILAWQTQRGVK
jgi:hypothetical protein